MKKKLLTLLIVAAVAISMLAGCNNQGSKVGVDGANKGTDTSSLEFVYVTMDIANPYFIAVYEGFKARCEELGISTQVLDSKYDVATQKTYVEDSIERGVDGIMISPLDENALMDVVEKAKKAGIVVAAEAQPVSNAQIDASLDEYKIGYAIGKAAGKWINEKLDGKGNVLLLAQDDVEAVIRRTDGARDAILEEAPESVIVARQNASNTDMGMKVTESVLLAHPEVNVITACDDYTAIGAYEAVSAMSNIAENFYIGGCDATDPAKDNMKAPNSVYRSSIDLFPYEAGVDIANAMYKYLTEVQEDSVVERRYEPVWQEDVLAAD